MRRILFTLLAVGAMVAAVPAASLAGGGHHHQGDRHREREHRREHRPGHHHNVQIRHERFGGIAAGHVRHDAGRVASFANGRLTIHLNDGSDVTGAVNRFTEVECEMSGAMHSFDHGSGGSGSGSSGSGGPGHHGDRNDPGDDRGNDGPRHDAGDDHGHDGPRHDAGDDHGHDGPGHHDGDRNQQRCATIAPGMVVRDATLTVTGFGAVWTRVDLLDS